MRDTWGTGVDAKKIPDGFCLGTLNRSAARVMLARAQAATFSSTRHFSPQRAGTFGERLPDDNVGWTFSSLPSA
jgi:hypothetical protein